MKDNGDGTYTVVEAVAQIGNTGYATLADAVAAAPTDGTETVIELVGEDNTITGSGVKVESGKNIVIDLNNKTYNVVNPTVGSQGTETNAFQMLKGSKVTFKDGALESAVAKIFLQNYCDLTLDNVKVNTQKNPQMQYAVSNNFGSLTVKNSSEIYGSPNQVAFDLWYGMNQSGLYDDGVTVTFDNTFNGKVDGTVEYGHASRVTAQDWQDKAALVINAPNGQFDINFEASSKDALNNANISISGGTFNSKPDVSYIAEGYGIVENNDKTYTVTKGAVIADEDASTAAQEAAEELNGKTVTSTVENFADVKAAVPTTGNTITDVQQTALDSSSVTKTLIITAPVKDAQKAADKFTSITYNVTPKVIFSDGTAPIEVHTLSEAVAVTLPLPGDLIGSGNTAQITHEGVVIPSTYDKDEKTVTFSSATFSDYTVTSVPESTGTASFTLTGPTGVTTVKTGDTYEVVLTNNAAFAGAEAITLYYNCTNADGTTSTAAPFTVSTKSAYKNLTFTEGTNSLTIKIQQNGDVPEDAELMHVTFNVNANGKPTGTYYFVVKDTPVVPEASLYGNAQTFTGANISVGLRYTVSYQNTGLVLEDKGINDASNTPTATVLRSDVENNADLTVHYNTVLDDATKYTTTFTVNVGGTALTSGDFTAASGTLTIPAAKLTGDVTINMNAEAKQYNVVLVNKLTGAGVDGLVGTDTGLAGVDTATYGTNYSLTGFGELSNTSKYSGYTIEAKIGDSEDLYNNGIAGSDIHGTGDTLTITATATPTTHTVTLGDGVSPVSGLSGEETKTATYGTGVKVKIDDYVKGLYQYTLKVDGTTVTFDETTGEYTIPGTSITGDKNVSLVKTPLFTVEGTATYVNGWAQIRVYPTDANSTATGYTLKIGSETKQMYKVTPMSGGTDTRVYYAYLVNTTAANAMSITAESFDANGNLNDAGKAVVMPLVSIGGTSEAVQISTHVVPIGATETFNDVLQTFRGMGVAIHNGSADGNGDTTADGGPTWHNKVADYMAYYLRADIDNSHQLNDSDVAAVRTAYDATKTQG